MSDVAVATETPKPVQSPAMRRRDGPRALPDNSAHFQISDFGLAQFVVTLPLGVTYEEAMDPIYWVNVAHHFKEKPVTREPALTGALIHLRTVDHAWYAVAYVLAVLEKGLTLKPIIEPVELQPKGFMEGKYDVRWNIGKRGFDIIRKADNTVVTKCCNQAAGI